MLHDCELVRLVRATPPLVSDIKPDIGSWDSRIQPASIDLSIGTIYRPLESLSDAEKGEYETGLSISLGQGETAVIETRETINLPATVAAIGFPPSSVSMQGLLMTNPGHVDPGYSGNSSSLS
jgi:dCTP deaminase